MNIFISSTYIDCINFRKAAIEAISLFNQKEINIIGMELFGARSKTTLEVCIEEVDRSNIYILIVAHRYGSVDVNTKKSYTQLEYEQAFKKKIPILVYFLDDQVPVFPNMVDKEENFRKLVEFKKHLVNNHTYQTFISDIDLKHKIITDLSRELKIDYLYNETFDFNDMELTPELYNQKEIIIKFIFKKDYYNSFIRKADTQIVNKLGLEKGNTLETTIEVITENRLKTSVLLCSGRFVRWLKSMKQVYSTLEKKSEDYIEYRLFEAKVKFVFATYKVLCYDEKYEYIDDYYTGFVLLDIPKLNGVFKENIDFFWSDDE